MKGLDLHGLLDAAVQTWVAERCAAQAVHDARGSLQAVHSAFELLGRAAQSVDGRSGIKEKAIAMARRTLSSHELAVTQMVQTLTSSAAAKTDVNWGTLVDEVLRFAGTDAARKKIRFDWHPASAVIISAERYKLRMFLVGLIFMAIDESPVGTSLKLRLSRGDTLGILHLQWDLLGRPIDEPEDIWRVRQTDIPAAGLLLASFRAWVTARGGSVELHSGPEPAPGLKIHYPVIPA